VAIQDKYGKQERHYLSEFINTVLCNIISLSEAIKCYENRVSTRVHEQQVLPLLCQIWHNVCEQIPFLPFFQSLMFACMCVCVASCALFTIMLHVNIITLSELNQTALKVEPHRSTNVNNAIFMCTVPSGSTLELNILNSFIPLFYLTKLSSDTTVSHYGSFKHIREEMSTM
jgi:hypothetical protein